MGEKILILGNGQIGNKYLKYFKSKGTATKLSKVDITKMDKVKAVVKEYEPTVIINTAAKTNLEYTDKNMTEAFDVNTRAVFDIASLAAEKKIYFVQLSSGCIFESKNSADAKTEKDLPNPSSYYAYTKAWSDSLITKYVKGDLKYLILRPRQPISGDVHYKNILMKLLSFTKYVDTPNTITSIDDLMVWTDKLISKRHVGIVNVANEGFTTPAKMAMLLKKHVLSDLEVNIITKDELDKITPVRRVDTVLDISLLKSLVGSVKTCDQAVEQAVLTLSKNFKSEEALVVNTQIDKTLDQTKTRAVPNRIISSLKK